MSIVVLGAIFVDIKGYPISSYIPGGRNVGRVEQVHGGVSRNIAEDIANIELRPTFVSLVDKSGIGEDVLSKLNKHKVNTNYIRKTEDGLGTWLAVFNNEGDVVASISKRPDLSPISDILDEQGDEIFKNCESILLEIDMDKDATKRTFQYAKKYNIPIFAAVSNMGIAIERRDLIQETSCFVCNAQEAGMFFMQDYEGFTPENLSKVLYENIVAAQIPCMVVTMGEQGAVYANLNGDYGTVPAQKVDVKDTTGAGDAFFSGVSIGLTYGKTLKESCEIGTRLSSAVICTSENVCPRFLPKELGIDIDIID